MESAGRLALLFVFARGRPANPARMPVNLTVSWVVSQFENPKNETR